MFSKLTTYFGLQNHKKKTKPFEITDKCKLYSLICVKSYEKLGHEHRLYINAILGARASQIIPRSASADKYLSQLAAVPIKTLNAIPEVEQKCAQECRNLMLKLQHKQKLKACIRLSYYPGKSYPYVIGFFGNNGEKFLNYWINAIGWYIAISSTDYKLCTNCKNANDYTKCKDYEGYEGYKECEDNEPWPTEYLLRDTCSSYYKPINASKPSLLYLRAKNSKRLLQIIEYVYEIINNKEIQGRRFKLSNKFKLDEKSISNRADLEWYIKFLGARRVSLLDKQIFILFYEKFLGKNY